MAGWLTDWLDDWLTEKTEITGLFKMSAVFSAVHEMAPLLSRSDDAGNRILWKPPFPRTSLHGVKLQMRNSNY